MMETSGQNSDLASARRVLEGIARQAAQLCDCQICLIFRAGESEPFASWPLRQAGPNFDIAAIPLPASGQMGEYVVDEPLSVEPSKESARWIGTVAIAQDDEPPLGKLCLLSAKVPQQARLNRRIVVGLAEIAATVLDDLPQRTDTPPLLAMHQTMLDLLPGMVAFWDRDLHNLCSNRAYQRWIGKTADEITGQHASEILPPPIYQRNLPLMQQALAGQYQYFERELTPAHGEESRFYEVHFLPCVEAGAGVNGVLVHALDITDRKRLAAELAQQQADFRDLYQSTPAMMISIDREGRIVTVSDTWLEKMGFVHEEVHAKHWTTFLTAECRNYGSEIVQQRLFNEGALTAVPMALVGKTGVVLEILLSAVTQRNARGEVVRALIVTKDVTALRMLERQLRDANRQAEALNRQRLAFLASASHELRSPLHTILGFSRLLQREVGEVTAEKLAIIESSGRQLSSLVESLLRFSRGQVNPEPPVYVSIDRMEFEALLRAQGQILAPQNGNRFAVNMDANLPNRLRLAERYLMEALGNLIGNACKYTQSGFVSVNVDYLPAPDDQAVPRIAFSVIDSGPGIDPNEQEHIFTPFYRGNNNAGMPGMGLGLAIAEQAVRQMDGNIRLESPPGKGCTFQFDLPLHAVDDELQGESSTHANPNQIVGHHPAGRKVLVVDDMADNRLFLRMLFERWGFVVLEADGCESALGVLAADVQSSIDLVIADQVMTDSSGWDLLSAMRANDRWSTLPIMLASATPPQPPASMRQGLKFDAVFLKPFDITQFALAIQKSLKLEWIVETAQAPRIEAAEPMLQAVQMIAYEQREKMQTMLWLGQLPTLKRHAMSLACADQRLMPFAVHIGTLCDQIKLGELEALIGEPTLASQGSEQTDS